MSHTVVEPVPKPRLKPPSDPLDRTGKGFTHA
jgi:hypothetical protein